jgi:hypothetical protein
LITHVNLVPKLRKYAIMTTLFISFRFVIHQDVLTSLNFTSTFDCVFLLLVDDNAIFVDYSKIALNPIYAEATSNIRLAATYVTQ